MSATFITTIPSSGPVQGQFTFVLDEMNLDNWADALELLEKRPDEKTLAELEAILESSA